MFRTFVGLVRQIRNRQRRSPTAPQADRPRRHRPRLEELEARCTPAVTITCGPVFHAASDGGFNPIAVDVQNGQEVIIANGGTVYSCNGHTSILIDEAVGSSTSAAIRANLTPVTVNLAGNDTVAVGNPIRGARDVQAALNITNQGGQTTLTVDNSADETGRTATIGAGAITGLAPAAINYQQDGLAALNVYGGLGVNTVTVTNTPNHPGPGVLTTLVTGGSVDRVPLYTVNVLATTGRLNINAGGPTVWVNVHRPGVGVQDIRGPLTFHSGPDCRMIVDGCDGTYDPPPHPGTLTRSGNTTDVLSGTAPAVITDITDGPTSELDVSSGGLNSSLTIIGHAPYLKLYATGCLVTLDRVRLGNPVNGVQDIQGPVTLENVAGIQVDDSADRGARTVVLDSVTFDRSAYGRISGLAPAPIQYRYGDTGSVTVDTGSPGATVNVLSTGVPTTLIGNGPSTANVGNSAHGVQDILAPLTITNPPDYTALNVDDAADTVPRTVGLVNSDPMPMITGLAPAPIYYRYADISGLAVMTGRGGATVNVASTGVPTTLIGNGPSTANVGNSAHGVQDIWGALTITNPPNYTALNVDDAADTVPRTVGLASSDPMPAITGLAPAPIYYRYADVSGLAVTTGRGGATVNVAATGVPTRLIGSGPNTAVNVGDAAGSLRDIRGPLDVSNPPDYTTLSAFAGNDPMPADVSITAGAITGLAPAAITYQQYDLDALNIFAGSAASAGTTFHIADTPGNGGPGVATALHTGGGTNRVCVQRTSATGPLTVFTGPGTNTIGVGAVDHDLSQIHSTVSVIDGPASLDTISLIDQGSTGPGDTYTLNDYSVDNSAGFTVVAFTNIVELRGYLSAYDQYIDHHCHGYYYTTHTDYPDC
jgi:hypothetical protein